jgi:hypothetical protein
MGSATIILDQLKAVIEADIDLRSYCELHLKKAHKVALGFKRRTEITSDATPLVRITRPKFVPADGQGRTGYCVHTVFCYIWFYCSDTAKAVQLLVELPELLEAAVLKDEKLGGVCHRIYSKYGAENDEGLFAPAYCSIIAFDIVARKNVPEPDEDLGMLSGFNVEHRLKPGDDVADATDIIDFPPDEGGA